MFIEVLTESQADVVEALAVEIWNEHYTPIIGKQQVSYMLEKFQSKEAMKEQIKNGYTYYLVEEGGCNIGYIGIELKKDELFLSKLYIKSSERGKGYGKKAVQFLEDLARGKKLNKISLTVNKNNVKSIAVYEKIGFKNLGSIIMDIGGGFVMDDYKMEKRI
ncbi:MAG: GNAT family N-acetyltransferase [Ignavibacteriaceae bacterium]|jgi:RimJ/RimL family protein N-acetyltransferase